MMLSLRFTSSLRQAFVELSLKSVTPARDFLRLLGKTII